MQLIDFLSVSSFALVYFNKDRFILFGSLKQNVPASPPTLLALSADGYFSGYNLISASPAGLMWEKQYLGKLIFNFIFFWSKGDRGWEWYGKRERESAKCTHIFWAFYLQVCSLWWTKRTGQLNSSTALWRTESDASFGVVLCYSWSIAGTRSCSLPMIPGL